MFFGNLRIRFFLKLIGLNVHNMEWKESIQKKEHNQHSSLFKVLRQLSHYLNVTDPLIIPLFLSFLSCHEKAHDNKEFRRENLKPRLESQITTC